MSPQWRRRLAYGSNATVVTLIVGAILVLLYVGAMQTRVAWDWTDEGRNTLTSDMVAKLALLDADGEPVMVTAFTAQRGTPDARFKNRTIRDLLTAIGTQSQTVDWRVVDFDQERLTAERLGVTQYSHVVVQRGGDRVDIRARDSFRSTGSKDNRQTRFLGEGAIARAFSQLHTPKRRVVYALSGHGERDAEGRGPEGLSDLSDALDLERYELESLDLMATQRSGDVPTVPSDAAVVLIAGASAGMTPHENDAIVSHISRGGGVIVAVDPGTPTPAFLRRLGVGVLSGVVADKRVVFPFWDRPIPVLQPHPLTASLRTGQLVPVMAHIAPINLADPMPTGIRAGALMTTSRDGWIERAGRLEGGAPVFDEGVDGVGPVTFGVGLEIRPATEWVSADAPPARIVVLGDSDFLSNGLLSDGPGNTTLALESVHWASGADARVSSVGARRQKVRRLAISAEQLKTVRVVSLGLLPVFFGLIGMAVRFSRRGR